MKDLQKVRKKLAESNKEKIRQLRDEYVDIFLEQLEKNNSKCIMYPSTVSVELVENVKEGLMTSETRAAEYNLQALYEAQVLLNKIDGYNVHVKPGKLFSKDALGKRLCGKVKIQ